MQEKLLNLQEAALNEIKDTSSIEAVESLRVKYLGKKGEITAILKEMGKLSAEERPAIGQVANKVRESIEGSISSKKEELKAIEKIREQNWDNYSYNGVFVPRVTHIISHNEDKESLINWAARIGYNKLMYYNMDLINNNI